MTMRTKVSWIELRVKNLKCLVIRPEIMPPIRPISPDTKLRKKKLASISPIVDIVYV